MTNIFDSIPDHLDDEVFDVLIRSKHVKIERIVSKGQVSSDWYDQPEDEWVMVLKGEAVIVFEDGEEMHLSEGDYINIPAHTKHKVKWTNPELETIWLAVHY
ncbi:MAG: cupin domain-containing protein [Mariprofundaceae bacterium]